MKFLKRCTFFAVFAVAAGIAQAGEPFSRVSLTTKLADSQVLRGSTLEMTYPTQSEVPAGAAQAFKVEVCIEGSPCKAYSLQAAEMTLANELDASEGDVVAVWLKPRPAAHDDDALLEYRVMRGRDTTADKLVAQLKSVAPLKETNWSSMSGGVFRAGVDAPLDVGVPGLVVKISQQGG